MQDRRPFVLALALAIAFFSAFGGKAPSPDSTPFPSLPLAGWGAAGAVGTRALGTGTPVVAARAVAPVSRLVRTLAPRKPARDPGRLPPGGRR